MLMPKEITLTWPKPLLGAAPPSKAHLLHLVFAPLEKLKTRQSPKVEQKHIITALPVHDHIGCHGWLDHDT